MTEIKTQIREFLAELKASGGKTAADAARHFGKTNSYIGKILKADAAALNRLQNLLGYFGLKLIVVKKEQDDTTNPEK